MLAIDTEGFELFSDACVEGALHLSVLTDELRHLKRLTPEQRNNESVIVDECRKLEDCLSIAIDAAKAIQSASRLSLGVRYFLRFMKEPPASYQVNSPKDLHANVAGAQLLRFASMHELVEFAAAALLDAAPDLTLLIGEGLTGNTNIAPELLQIAETRLISLTHEEDESGRLSFDDDIVCEERLHLERIAVHAAARGE